MMLWHRKMQKLCGPSFVRFVSSFGVIFKILFAILIHPFYHLCTFEAICIPAIPIAQISFDSYRDIWPTASSPHHNMSYSGCEIIAAFNAKKVFGFPGTAEEMAELIYEFESCGAALWGEFGTSPAAIAKQTDCGT